MSAGGVLFRIADLSTVWVLADVPEYDLANVQLGQMATIRVRGLPGQSFQGHVALIYPQVNSETRSTKVRIEIPNSAGQLRPDMYADVEIAASAGKPVVAVPDSAVIDTGTRQIVILDKGEGLFEPRDVKIGAQGGGLTEVRSGIAIGDKVVCRGEFPDRCREQPESRLERHGRWNGGHAVIARLIAWSARNLVLILVGTVFAVAAGGLCRQDLDRSTRYPISRTSRSSSTPNIRARRRRGDRGPGHLSLDRPPC